jgi:predicted nuclease of predicted toxin-antitoxin system
LKVLLDHNVPVQLKEFLEGHSAFSARELGWDLLKNGDLMTAAEIAGFDVMVTGDQNIAYQHNNSTRAVSLVVITQTKRRIVSAHHRMIGEAIARCLPGSFELVTMPGRRRGIQALE